MSKKRGSDTVFVSERFMSIQGEGYWTGTPSWFIRLQGCSIGCSWCDTKHTWKKGVGQISVQELVEEIPALADRVVITGGEPFEQDISQLIEEIDLSGRSVQVETSGACETYGRCWLTVSPKAGRNVTKSAKNMADEFKQVISCVDDLHVLSEASSGRDDVWVYLQPKDNDAQLIKLCIEMCIKSGYRLSLQTHKMIGIQ